MLRNLPKEMAEILSEELKMGNCSLCGETKLVSPRNDYIIDIGDICDDCMYYRWYEDRHDGKSRGRTVYLTKATEVCFDCLEEQNDIKLDELKKYG